MKIKLAILFLIISGLLNAVVVTSWDFESQSTSPTTGSGSLSLLGGVTSDNFNTGYGDTGYAWSTTSYPAQGTNNRSAGMFIEVSSVGYSNISLNWAIRHSNTSANREVLYYTLDRTEANPVWVEAATFNATNGDQWVLGSFDGTAIPGMNSNPNLAFKIVSSFANTANTAYMPSKTTSSYAASCKWRYDNISLIGTPAIPSLQVTADLQPFYAAPDDISVVQSYQLTAVNLTGNVLINAPQYFAIRVLGDELFSAQLTLTPRSGILDRTIQVLFQPVASGEYGGFLVHSGGGVSEQSIAVYGSTVLPEPSAYPSSFSVSGVTYYQAYLNWVDASGTTLPDGYLIKGSKVSMEDIIPPVDGIPEIDKKLTKNVAYGQQNQLIFELNESHPYYFKIYPYTNADTAIDYKIDSSVPELTFSTGAGPIGATLDVGDIAFVEYACDSPDRFAFVLLRDIPENTKINFTDKAWTGTAFAETEEVYEWRGVARPYLKGEVIHIVEGTLQNDEGISNPDFEGFSNDGDQIIAFQGYITEPYFLAAFSTTNWLSSVIPTNNSSFLPTTLTQGDTALGFTSEVDNGYYNGTQTGSVAAILAMINNPANWTRANSLSGLSYPNWSFALSLLAIPQVSICQVDANGLRLTWQEVSGADTYSVYSSNEPDAVFPDDWTLVLDSTSSLFYDINPPSSSKCFYRVVAAN